MKKNILAIGMIVIFFLQGCASEVETISGPTLKQTIVIKKVQDLILAELDIDLNNDAQSEYIELIFNTESKIILKVNEQELIISNDLFYMVNSANIEKRSNYKLKVIEDKIFVINDFYNKEFKYDDIGIRCFTYQEEQINEIWTSRNPLGLKVESKRDDQKEVVISHESFVHHVTLDDGLYNKVFNEQLKDLSYVNCSLGDSIDYRFIDYDEDGDLELLVKGKVSLNNQYNIKPFYRIYELSESIFLDNCGFYDEIETEQYFN